DAIQKMEKAKSIEEAKVMLEKAENDDNRLSEQQSVSANTQIEDSNITEDNHESYEDKKDISDNQKHVTDHQEKTVPSEKTHSSNIPEQENNQPQNAHARITSENSQQNLDQLLDKIDALSNEVDGGKLKNDNEALRDTGDKQEQQNKVAKSTNSKGEKNQAEKNTPEKTSRSDHDVRSEERRVGKECRNTRSKRDWSSDVCSSDLDQLLDKIDALSNEVDGGKLKNDNEALRDTGDKQEQQNKVAKSTNSKGEKNQAEKNTPEKTSRSDHDV